MYSNAFIVPNVRVKELHPCRGIQQPSSIQNVPTIAAADQSSSSATPSININGGIESSILESLQCIICLDVCVSPIYACTENGHLTCGSCHHKATQLLTRRQQCVKCSFCKVSLAVNTFADRLSRKWEIKVSCPHADAGCNEVFPAATFLEQGHIKDCEYRPIKCYNVETSSSSCNDPIPMELFADHMTRVHKKAIKSGASWDSRFGIEHLFKNMDPESHSYWNGVNTPPYMTNMIEFDGRTFIVNTHIRNKTRYWWILLLGEQKNASYYQCKTQLIPRKSRPGKISALFKSNIVQTIPVLGYHNHVQFDEFCPHYASATAAQVTAACLEDKRPNGETVFVFQISFELIKNGANGNGVTSAQQGILGKRRILTSASIPSSSLIYQIN